MNTLINITILSILFCKFSFPQFYADSVLANEVVEFVNIANEKTINFSIYNRPKIDFTDDELEHLLALYYKCYSIYTVCFNDYMAEEHKKWEKASLNVTTGEMKLRPWMRVYSLVNQLSNKFGHKFISIIGIPAFIRGKFIELNFSTHILKDTNTKFRVHNFSFEVEEVLKGDKYFQLGDTISIDMIPNVESPAPSFMTGKSYLIPVTTLLGHQDDGFNTIFSYLTDQRSGWEMGKLPTTFPIADEIIKNVDYFGIQDTSWTNFKKYFKDTYLIFE